MEKIKGILTTTLKTFNDTRNEYYGVRYDNVILSLNL